jgi:hypothetical protein
LPANATNEEALNWLFRMRRVIRRWRYFPHIRRPSSADMHAARHALDTTEFLVLINMGLPLPRWWRSRNSTRTLGLFLGRLLLLLRRRFSRCAIGRA